VHFDLKEMKSKKDALQIQGRSALCFTPKDRNHNELSPLISSEAENKLTRRATDRRAADFRALDLVADPLLFQKVSAVYEALLEYCGELSEEPLRYLRTHAISEDTARKFRFGYVSDYAKSINYLVDRFPEELLVWTGLFNDKGNFRFYKHRLLIPYTLDGRVVYVQGRILESGVEPEEIGLDRPFPCPFNIDVVKRDGVKKVYLCEGAIDTLTLVERGLPAIGIPGYRGFKREWIRYFLGKQTLLVVNPDSQGRQNVSFIHNLFARAMFRFKIVVLPPGERMLKPTLRSYARSRLSDGASPGGVCWMAVPFRDDNTFGGYVGAQPLSIFFG
jgi:hypothetical protein